MASEEVKEFDGVTAGEAGKLDEFNIGEFRPEPEEADKDKSKRKLQEVEESMKEVRELQRRFDQQRKDMLATEAEIDAIIAAEGPAP